MLAIATKSTSELPYGGPTFMSKKGVNKFFIPAHTGLSAHTSAAGSALYAENQEMGRDLDNSYRANEDGIL